MFPGDQLIPTTILPSLGYAAFAFVATKYIFVLAGWYYQHDKDPILRRHLDRYFDQLEKASLLRAFSSNFFGHLVHRINETFPDKRTSLLKFAGLAFLSYYFLAFVGSLVDLSLNDQVQHLSYFAGMASQGIIPFPAAILITYFCMAFGCTVGTLLSLMVTWRLLQRASQTNSVALVALCLVEDAAFALTAAVWVFFVFRLPTCLLEFHFDRGIVWNMVDECRWLLRYGLGTSDRDLVYPVIMGLGPLLPTLAYWLIGGMLFASHFTFSTIPKSSRRVIAKCIFLITTDRAPIMSQLGNVLGALAALLAGVISLAR